MRPTGSSGTVPAPRRAWEAPAFTRLAIGRETRSAGAGEQGSAAAAHPEPPAAPATKFGFSFELSFPLSARIDK
jgi:hypothetical protein